MTNQQSAGRSTSSTEQHKLICQLRTNTTACTWPENDHSNGVRGHSNSQARHPHTSPKSLLGKKNTKQCDTSAGRSTSSTKQHELICQLRTNTTACTWPANDLSNGVRDHSNSRARHPHTCLQRDFSGKKNTKQCDTGTNACHHWFLPWILSTHYHLRVALLNNRRNLYNTTLEAPGTQPLAMLLCGFSWRCKRNH